MITVLHLLKGCSEQKQELWTCCITTFENVTVYDKTMRTAKYQCCSVANFQKKKINLTHLAPPALIRTVIKLPTINGQNDPFWLTHVDVCPLLHKGMTYKSWATILSVLRPLKKSMCTHTCYIYFHSTTFTINNLLGSKIYHTLNFKRGWVVENNYCTSCLCMFPRQLEQRKHYIGYLLYLLLYLWMYSTHAGKGLFQE